MVPDRRGAVGVGILEGREARPPVQAEGGLRLPGEEVVPGALRREAVWNVLGRRQIPGLRIAVALITDTNGPVDVGHHRDRAGIGAGRFTEGRASVASIQSAGWVRPVERRIDRKEMRKVVPVRIDQVVDPLDPDRPLPASLDGERRGVVDQQSTVAITRDRAVAPDRRRRHAGRQDLLRELPHRDLVVVDRLAALRVDHPCPRHHGRDQHRAHELADVARIERGIGDRDGADDPRTSGERHEEQAGPRRSGANEELTPR